MATPQYAPPLPPGWTEFMGPTGAPYYYNTSTQESTYTRPMPTFSGLAQMQQQAGGKKKKEKPLLKTPIAGTPWLRVLTTEGNTFYTHTGRKESVWTVPDEIKDAVAQLELEEAQKKVEEQRVKEREAVEELERIKSEVQGAVKKRAAEVDVPVDEVVVLKKARVDEDEDEEDGEESEEEDWQREAAEQLVAEAEEERKRQEEEAKEEERRRIEDEEELAKQARKLNLPDRVDLSLEEGKALFKTLLREKDINPLLPWDSSLPLFVSDPRYVLLPSVSARKEAFDEYCRDRAREIKEQKVKEQKEMADPKETFEKLLKDEVKSTRTSWTDWRRQWKKDRRFYGWGKDDREREKRFKQYLKELGEKKRAEAQKAEVKFFALLKESGVAKEGADWKEVKRKIYKDPRYDAVGSSSLREELFNTYLKARSSETEPSVAPDQHIPDEVDRMVEEVDEERKRKERKERAVKEREEKVRAEKSRLEAEIGRTKMGVDKEEGEREFRTMLVDAIRDPQITWDAAVGQLKIDPRFTRSPLPVNHQIHLFQDHIGSLRGRHLNSLHALFESHAPSLATGFSELPTSSLMSSLPATKLGLSERRAEDEFSKWQRERNEAARLAFDEMLGENAFIEFWGRLGKLGGDGVNGGVKAEEEGMEEDEGQGGGGRADMKALAKTIDLKEIIKVVKNDKRYLVFDHAPEQREGWIRDYLSRLSAPGMSVHIPDKA